MVKLKQEYLSFFQLAEYFGCSRQYLHDLISTAKIIPAVLLSDGERYPGGQFREAYDFGDGVQFGAHTDFDEVYGQDNHGENWPQCAPIVYCHFPERDTPDDYSFGVFSENASSSATKVFYYPRGDKLIRNKSDGENRFNFFWSEIKRFESTFANTKTPSDDGALNEWVIAARDIAEKHYLEVKKRGHDINLEKMSQYVETEMSNQDINGVNFRLKASTIKREALQGAWWQGLKNQSQ